MPTFTLLGNCVAHRLQEILLRCPAVTRAWTCLPAPMIHTLQGDQCAEVAAMAQSADRVFSQPLFHYAECNTEQLRPKLQQRLITFSAPNFEAYFPDVFRLSPPRPTGLEERFPPPLEWHSRIFLLAYLAKIPSWEVAPFYKKQRLFTKVTFQKNLAQSKSNYRKREQGVDIGTEHFVEKHYASTALFYTWQHPHDSLLLFMLKAILANLDVEEDPKVLEKEVTAGSFSFNQWPILTQPHAGFSFAQRDYFVVAGKKSSLEDVAAGYYNYYDFHPHLVEKAKESLL